MRERALGIVLAHSVLVEVLALHRLVFLVSAWLSELTTASDGSPAHLPTSSLDKSTSTHVASRVEPSSLAHVSSWLLLHATSWLLLLLALHGVRLLWLLLEFSGTTCLLVAVLPLLALECNLELLRVKGIVWLPEFLVSVCEVALVPECAVFVCFEMSAPLGLVLIVDLVCVHRWFLEVVVLTLHLGLHLVLHLWLSHRHHHLLTHGHVHHVHIRGLV